MKKKLQRSQIRYINASLSFINLYSYSLLSQFILSCVCSCVFSQGGSEDECIPIGDFSFDPHKLICCSLESGNILSHGSGGKGYGLATTAITSGCFIWKVQKKIPMTPKTISLHDPFLFPLFDL